jgi:Tfp pilus assembly protein PilF
MTAFPEELVTALANGRGVLWAGVGVGAAMGAPPWSPLLLSLVERCPPELQHDLTELVGEGRLATVLTFLQRRLGAQAIAEQFGDAAASGENAPIPDGLTSLAEIRWRATLATAYAPALRRVFESGGQRVQVLRHNYAHNLSLGRGGDPFVLSTPPIGAGMRADQTLYDLIEEAVHTRTIFYLGFRAHDPDFLEITRLLQRIGRGRRHYAYLADLTPPEIEELDARYNIEVIPADEELPALVVELAAAVGRKDAEDVSRPEIGAALDLARCVRHVDVRGDFALDDALALDIEELRELAEAAGGVRSKNISTRARLQYGVCLLAHGDPDEASRCFGHVIAKGASEEDGAIAQFNLALAAASSGDSDVATQSFAAAADQRRSLALVPPQFRVEAIVERRGSRLDVRCLDHASRDTVELEVHTLDRLGGPATRKTFYEQLKKLTGVRHSVLRRVKGGFADGRHFGLLCEPLVDFKPLDVVLAEHGLLGLPEMAAVLGPVIDAISQLHDAGLTHGGLHPRDIVVTEAGPKVRGIGIDPVVDYHRPSLVSATRGYAAPEALAGGALLPAADVFAMGSLMARVLTGAPVADDAAFAKIGDARAVALIREATNRAPARRPSMKQLAARLRKILSTPAMTTDVGAAESSGASPAAVAAAIADAVGPVEARAAAAESERAAAHAQAQEALARAEAAEAELTGARIQAEETRVELDRLRTQAEDQDAQASEAQDAELAGLKSELEAAVAALTESEAALIESERKRADAEAAATSVAAATVGGDPSAAAAELSALGQKVAAYEAALQESESELGPLRERASTAESALSQAQAEIARLNEEANVGAGEARRLIKRTTGELSDVKLDLEQAAAEVEAARARAETAEAERAALQAELESSVRELEAERARQNSTRADVDSAAVEIEQQRAAAVAQAFEAGERVVELERELAEARAQAEARQAEVEAATALASQADSNVVESAEALDEMKGKILELETALGTSQTELGQLKTALEDAQQQRVAAEEALSAAKVELEAAAGELATEREAAAAGVATRTTVPVPEDPDDLEGWVYVLEHRPNDMDARDAIATIEVKSREEERWDRVAEVLRTRVELSQVQEVRVALLRELAEIYEHKLGAPVFAFETLVSLIEEISMRAQVRLSEDVLRLGGVTGRWSKAAEIVARLAEKAPDEEDRLRLSLSMARIYAEELGAVDQAHAMYARALELDAENVDLHDEAAEFLRRSNRPVELASVLLNLAELTQGEVRHGHLLAGARLMTDEFEEHEDALEMVEVVRSEDGTNEEAIELAESLARTLERDDLLVEVLEARANLAGGVMAVDDLREAARLRSAGDDAERTLAAWRAVLDADPDDEEASGHVVAILRGRVEGGEEAPGELVDALLHQAERIENDRARMEMVAQAVAWLDRPGAAETDMDRALDLRREIVSTLPMGDSLVAVAADSLLQAYGAREDWGALKDLLRRLTDDPELNPQVRLGALNKLLSLVGPDGPAENVSDEREILEELERDQKLDAKQRERLVSMLLADGESDRAAALMKDAANVADTQGRVEMILEIARVRFEDREYEAAEEQAKEVLGERPNSLAAWALLRDIYRATERETQAAEASVQVANHTPEGPSRAEASFEAAQVAHDVLGQPEAAMEFLERVIADDPDHVEATRLLFERLVELGEKAKAWPHAQRRAQHAEAASMPRAEHAQLLVLAGECALAAGETDGAREMLGSARRLDATNMSIARVLADLDLEAGQFQDALAGYQSAALASSTLPASERALLYMKMGEACLGLGEDSKGVRMLERAVELDPDFEPAIRRLIELAPEERDRVLAQQKLLELFARVESPSEEQSAEELALLRDTAGFVAREMKRPAQATAMLERALELQPGDPAILHQMLELHTGSKDWRAATGVLEQLADMQEDGVARAKYLYAGAVFVRDNLEARDEALEWMGRVLEADPLHEKAYRSKLDILKAKEEWKEVSRAIRARMTNLPETEADGRIALLDELAGVYESKIGDIATAYAAYEKAYEVGMMVGQTEQEPRVRKLYDLALRMGEDGYDRAVAGAQLLITQRPMDFETYHQLFELFLESNQRDSAACVARALRFLKQAEAAELKLAEEADRYHPPRGALTPELWGKTLMHVKQSVRLTDLFATVWAVIAARAEASHSVFGVTRDDRMAVDLKEKGIPRMIAYSCKVLDVPFPDVFGRKGEPGDIRIHALVDQNIVYSTLMLGDAALKKQDDQAWAFRAGRAACRAAPSMLMASVLPSGGGLKEVVFGALLAVNPEFPVPGESRARSSAYAEAMRKKLPPAALDYLSKAVQRVVEAGSLDTSAWLAGAEYTANRAGFVMADSLDVAAMIISKGSEVGNVPPRDLVKDLVSYSVSAPYLRLRHALKQDQ